MLHKSRILTAYLCLYLISTVIFLNINKSIDFLYVITPIIIAILFWNLKVIRYFALMIAIILLSAAQISLMRIKPKINPGPIFNATVIEAPINVSYGQRTVLKSTGNIRLLAYLPVYPVLRVGDSVSFSGIPIVIQNTSGYVQNRGYYLTKKIDYEIKDIKNIELTKTSLTGINKFSFLILRYLSMIKESYENIIFKILPEPYAGLANGILLGSKSEINDNIINIFTAVGIIHIMALSGYNITVIANGLRITTNRLSPGISSLISFMGVWAFVLATGFSASVVRAAIMGSLIIVSVRAGRQSDSINALLIAAVIMVALNPNIILYDLGFQLSFAAMVGMLFLAPRIKKYFIALGSKFADILSATLSAQLFTLPLLSYFFGQISLISVLANILILPLIPLVMTLIFIVATVGFASVWLSQKIGFILWLLLGYIVKVSSMLGSVPGVNNKYQMSIPMLIGIYLLLIEIVFIMIKKERKVVVEE